MIIQCYSNFIIPFNKLQNPDYKSLMLWPHLAGSITIFIYTLPTSTQSRPSMVNWLQLKVVRGNGFSSHLN